MNYKGRIAVVGAILATVGILTSCSEDKADVAAHNLSKAADNFEIGRIITVIDTETGKELFTAEGLCSLEDQGSQLELICKDNNDFGYSKHMIGLGPDITYVAEQVEPAEVSTEYFRVTFNPSVAIPDVHVQ